jgi:dienelactone hydrolase
MHPHQSILSNWFFRMAIIFLLGILAMKTAMGQTPTKTETITSGGKSITVERFEPEEAGIYPAVVLVHGLDGLEATGDAYRAIAQKLAWKKYVVLLVHYFDSTGTSSKESMGMVPAFQKYLENENLSKKDRQRLDELWAVWKDTIRDSVRHCQNLPQVRKDHVAVVGVSLGAFLSLSLVAEQEIRVAAVVDLFGGLPHSLHGRTKNFPPVLIIHGDQDQVVPVRHAQTLEKLLLSCNCQVELKIYKVGHAFLKEDQQIDRMAAWNAELCMHQYLNQHLITGQLVQVDE